MTPFVLDYAMYYADSKNSTVFSDAHNLATETLNGKKLIEKVFLLACYGSVRSLFEKAFSTKITPFGF